MRVTRSTVRWFCGPRSCGWADVPLDRVASEACRGVRGGAFGFSRRKSDSICRATRERLTIEVTSMRLRALLQGFAAFCVMPSMATAQNVTATIDFAQVNQTSLRYELRGRGPRTIVLLHELGLSLESWDGIV